MAEPEEAEIVVAPTAIAMLTPPASTAATPGLELTQLTAAPGIGLPDWSCTEAMNCTVCPSASRVADDGVTDTVVGTGVGGSSGDPPSQPKDQGKDSRTTTERDLIGQRFGVHMDGIGERGWLKQVSGSGKGIQPWLLQTRDPKGSRSRPSVWQALQVGGAYLGRVGEG